MLEYGMMAAQGEAGVGKRPYCSRHKRSYHSVQDGCELCRYEEAALRYRGGDGPRLLRCPDCGQMSLIVYQCRNSCECLNIDCKLQVAPDKDY